MTQRFLGLGLALSVALASACREVPQAPIATPPPSALYATVTLDRICPACVVDTGNLWSGITLLQPSDQSVHVVALDPLARRLRYHGCVNACSDPRNWYTGTGDTTALLTGFWNWSSAALTVTGIHVVYTICPDASCIGVRYAYCPGICFHPANWTDTTLFVGRGTLEAGYGGQSISLAADSAGGLHLLFSAPLAPLPGPALRYAHCAAGCASPANWQDVQLDAEGGGQTRLIAFDLHSGLHVFSSTSAGLIHRTCTTNCTSVGSWQSGPMAGGVNAAGLALAFGADGRLHLVYMNRTGAPTYATCPAPCGAPGSWSTVALPLRTSDVSLAIARGGTLFLATTDSTVEVSRCTADCLVAKSWQTTVVDSAAGGGHVSIAVDSSDHARIVSTAGWPNILQYSQMKN
jgi:hypothetical protein